MAAPTFYHYLLDHAHFLQGHAPYSTPRLLLPYPQDADTWPRPPSSKPRPLPTGHAHLQTQPRSLPHVATPPRANHAHFPQATPHPGRPRPLPLDSSQGCTAWPRPHDKPRPLPPQATPPSLPYPQRGPPPPQLKGGSVTPPANLWGSHAGPTPSPAVGFCSGIPPAALNPQLLHLSPLPHTSLPAIPTERTTGSAPPHN